MELSAQAINKFIAIDEREFNEFSSREDAIVVQEPNPIERRAIEESDTSKPVKLETAFYERPPQVFWGSC
jgi:hypothetical protein